MPKLKIPNIKLKKFKKKKKLEDTKDFLNLIIDEENETIQLKDTEEYIGAIAISPINIFNLREREQTKYVNVFESFVNNKKFTSYQIYSSETGSDINAYVDQLNDLQKPFS